MFHPLNPVAPLSDPSLQEIIACVGHPVAGNPAQFVMERAFAAANVDSRCLTVDVAPSRLESAIRGMDSMGFSGAIVAAPHQLACRQFLMSESPECTKLGEVDLIHRESNGFVGANTTYRAACELLASKGPLLDKRAVVFGSGSDARAVALALSQSGVAMLTVVAADDGDEERIGTMVRDHTDCPLDLQLWAGMYRVPGDTDIVVQTTSSVDLDLNPSLSIDWAGITPAMLLLDTTYEYGSPQTEFVRLGTNAGAQCISGIDLFVQRSVAAFRLWTMLEPDALVMRDAIEEFMLV